MNDDVYIYIKSVFKALHRYEERKRRDGDRHNGDIEHENHRHRHASPDALAHGRRLFDHRFLFGFFHGFVFFCETQNP